MADLASLRVEENRYGGWSVFIGEESTQDSFLGAWATEALANAFVQGVRTGARIALLDFQSTDKESSANGD